MLPKDYDYPDLASRITLIVETSFENNQSKMARDIGAGSAGTIGNWINRNQGMDASYAFFLQDNYGWNARWIIEGVLPRRKDVGEREAEALFNELLAMPAENRQAWLLLMRTRSPTILPSSST